MSAARAPAERPPLPQPGDVIGDKYRLERVLGKGGMGVVFEATHVRLRQRLAIKIVRPDAPKFAETIARFSREARIAAKMRSIHTARVIDVDELPGGLPFMVLEYLDGRDLGEELSECGRLGVEDAVDVALQVCDAMEEAHALGVVHRDLKPSNLFVCRVAGRRVVKVLDFGISKDSEGERITTSAAYFGTPYYTAPEQLRAAGAADARSDIWSLGVVLFELLTGRLPFEGGPTEVIAKVVCESAPRAIQFRPELPRDLSRLVERALQREPAKRFGSMREFAQALAPFGPQKTVAAAMADAPRSRGRLGEVLIAEGMITQEDLDRALARQRETGHLLGRILVDMGLITRADLLAALTTQHGLIVMPESPPSRHGPGSETLQREAPTVQRESVVEAPRIPRWVSVGLPLLAIASVVAVVAAIVLH